MVKPRWLWQEARFDNCLSKRIGPLSVGQAARAKVADRTVPNAMPVARPGGRSTQGDHRASQEFVPRHGIEAVIYVPGCDSLRATRGQKMEGLRDVKIAPVNSALF